jgi:gamma-glutamyltranspeptidase/glutathione hydrolase
VRTHPLWLALLLALFLVLAAPGSAGQPGTSAAVATENATSSKEALAVLARGGNAVDAAITAALVAGVTSPSSSGIGGGGFAIVWQAASRQASIVDFREVAPRGIDAAAFEHRPFSPAERAKYSGIPGELAGLFELSHRFGKLPWKELVEPAARVAKTGFPVSAHLGAMLGFAAKDLRQDPGISALFFPKGKPAAVGSLLKNDALAATLTRVAAEGPSALYTGSIAKDLVDAANSKGGALTEAELGAYKPVDRAPLHVRWEGYDVYTMPPPSAGGMMLAETLGLFSRAELAKLGAGSGAYQHVLAEAMRGAVADRMRYLGDPDVVKVDLTGLLAGARLARRKKTIAVDRTHAIPRFGLEEHGTHEIVTADAAGDVVSLTTTVNRVFGAKLTGSASGVVLNDELDDFSKKTDVAAFGMSESPNRPRPGARPVSSMTPTVVVKDGKAVLAIGGSGGSAIATNVTQVLLSRLVFGTTPLDAVKAARFYIPPGGRSILLEKGAPQSLIDDLEYRGEVVGENRFTSSAVQLIAVENGRKLPASDPRKHGVALTR